MNISDHAGRVPTDAEQAEIDAFQNGAYGAEPPDWWLQQASRPAIPDEAVEAAAKYLSEKFNWNGALVPVTAREILEAAAPQLMAAAWDEGYEGAVDAYDGRNVSNPYRKASHGNH